MKKLIALFAILVAFTATTFALPSDNAKATVNVYEATNVAVTVSSDNTTFEEGPITINIVEGTAKVIYFKAAITYDADYTGSWPTTGNGWTFDNSTDFTNAETLAASPSNGTASSTATSTLPATTGDGTYSVTATYTFNYPF